MGRLSVGVADRVSVIAVDGLWASCELLDVLPLDVVVVESEVDVTVLSIGAISLGSAMGDVVESVASALSLRLPRFVSSCVRRFSVGLLDLRGFDDSFILIFSVRGTISSG